jgi:tetratricopeptide (TPR) repeat protein
MFGVRLRTALGTTFGVVLVAWSGLLIAATSPAWGEVPTAPSPLLPSAAPAFSPHDPSTGPHNPAEAARRFEVGLRHAMARDLAQAVGAFRAAIALEPGNPFFHYNLGLIYGMQRHLGAATAEMRTTVSLKPDFPAARFRLGLLLETAGRYEEAVAEYIALLSGDSIGWETAAARDRLARVRETLQAKREAPAGP